MNIGYCRTSTIEQIAGFEAQRRELDAAGCKKVFQEQVSSVAQRDQLEAALDFIREGDTLIVTKLDRLARSMADLMTIVTRIKAKGASLRILAMGLDTNGATGELMVNVLGSVAQFERSMMLERQREGIAKARAEKRYKGRAPTPDAKRTKVIELRAAKVKHEDIAAQLKISRATVFRILKEAAAPNLERGRGSTVSS